MTSDRPSRTWMITGASNGLGLALATHVLKNGDQTVLAAPTLPGMAALAAAYPKTAFAVAMDVTVPEQRAATLQASEARFGGVDVLVNNAGIDFLGAIEEQREEDYRRLFEVNLFGVIEMIRLALPGMRRRGRGTVVNISSMDGVSSLPATGYYSASKFALEGLTEALWQEIEPLGLRAITVQPGSFRTAIEQRTRFSGQPIDDYAATSGAFRRLVSSATPEMFPGDPARAAAAIWKVVINGDSRRRIVLGSDAQRRIAAQFDVLRAELEAGRDMAMGTDYPGSGPSIL
ncbi:SDR family NAD(P)-dependent oxidoreductase [uncultured Phenylobacterium sp.]|uniref:SDR family NAD(P)-dependent oxidoreductase n=1 Tax=uncultured Phenylobacterium sp. TaxID=349273 RepID=UPI0025E42ED2|nr:SDR family NAD(P)-dependent oxidoreductase [uncultured Phenylobacterium sp.]